MKKILCILMLLFVIGCTDARWKNITTLGSPGKIQLYSGGQVVREWMSTGKIVSEAQTDGWRFVDQKTGKLIRVTGTVVIIN